MRNKITLTLLFLFACAMPTSAHPSGNFSVSNYSRIGIEKNPIRPRRVLDMAEIPAFRESRQIDTDKNNALSNEELNAYPEKLNAQYAAGLKLSADNQPVQIQTAGKHIFLPSGAGNLPRNDVNEFSRQLAASFHGSAF